MLTLLKNADLYTPEHLGVRDVLLCGGKIARIAPALPAYEALPDVTVYDAQGARVIPGLIDLHIHITGGGGEQGAPSRVPEIMLSQLTENGVTTVLGLLGTDGYTRSMENLLYKANALTAEGITCYLLTGSYQYPSPTLTGSVARDIMMLAPCVGVKVALSDHRSSNLTPDELVRLASDARVAGLLSGKAGLVVLHMGSGKNRMEYILRAVDETDIPVRTFLPTHCGRNDALMEHAVAFAQRGGVFDLTAGDGGAAHYLAWALARGVDERHITLSSDANGSQPRFDAQGNCVGLTYVSPAVLLSELRIAVSRDKVPFVTAVRTLTENPAAVLGLAGVKGCIAEGADADLVVLDGETRVHTVFARGVLAVRDGKAVLRGTFEA